MMSGKAWVGYRLAECGWVIDVADARKVKAVAPLACKVARTAHDGDDVLHRQRIGGTRSPLLRGARPQW
jgi:hypothetical protein